MDTRRTNPRTRPADWLRRRLVPRFYDRRRFFGGVFERVSKIFRLSDLLSYLSNTLVEGLDLSSLAILIKRGSSFDVVHTTGKLDAASVSFLANSSMVTHLKRGTTPTVLDKGHFDAWRLLATQDEISSLDRLRARMLVPFVGRSGLVGFAALSQRSHRGFSGYELHLFRLLGSQVGLALEAALTLEELNQESMRRERAARELELAREVQERMLPQRTPPLIGASIAGRCVSAQEVGGDYYDMFLTVDGDLCFALGDVSGKGISSALLMATLRASLHSLTLDNDLGPTQLMSKLNRLIYEASSQNRFATFVVFFYRAASKTLTYVNAGHNAPLLLRGHEVVRLETGGPVLGLFPDCSYEQETVQIHPGELLVLYSDGVTESLNPAGDEWCEEGLLAAVRDRRKGAGAIVEDVLNKLRVFANGTPQPDDITLLVFETDPRALPADEALRLAGIGDRAEERSAQILD
jgi:sigma-B regulation protein RsbU (phosphoserine phosphatase)